MTISRILITSTLLLGSIAGLAQTPSHAPLTITSVAVSNDGGRLVAVVSRDGAAPSTLSVAAIDGDGHALPAWLGPAPVAATAGPWSSLGVLPARAVVRVSFSLRAAAKGAIQIGARDDEGHQATRTIAGPDVPPNVAPVAWPSETIGAGGWTPYTEVGAVLKDKSAPEGDCSKGATQNGDTEIIRGDSPFYSSALYAFDAVNNVFFYRIRVEAMPLSNGGRTTGNGTGANPWDNPTWNLMIDTDGDGFKEFNVVLDGGSGGGSNRDIGVTPGTTDGDDLKIYYNNTNTQCVTTETVANDVVTAPGDLVWWGNSATQSATVPPSETADGATWDFGRTRCVVHTAANGTWGRGHMVDFQFPIAALTDAWNGGAGGNVLVGLQTPLAFGYSTSNSNADPLQKDYASDYCYTPSCALAFPYADIVRLSGGTTQTPIIGAARITGITCPSSVTVSVPIADALQVVPPTSGTGTVTDTIASATFQYYADLDGDGKANDGSTWTNMAVVGSSLNPDNRGDLAPNGTTASFNDWGVVWNTGSLAFGQYLIRVVAVDDSANSATQIVGAYIVASGGQCRVGTAASWESYADANHTLVQDLFQNNPASTVYMAGLFASATTYKVAYYDATGALITTATTTSDSFGNLQGSLVVGPSSPTGTYHAVVYPSTFTPPSTYNGTYNATTNPIVGNDSFVVAPPPPAPIVNSPIYQGATSVSGTSTQPVGSIITVYVNGIAVGTTTVQPGGTWTLTGIGPLVDGDVVTAQVQVGVLTSLPSSPVVVSSNPADVTPPPVVSSPIFAGATSISGTSVSPAGTTIDVYVNGAFVGTTTVQAGGTWTLAGVAPLADGDAIYARATDTAAGKGTSAPSPTVYVSANAGNVSDPPVVRSPIYSGARVVSGTSTEAAGTRIDVYVNGVAVGQTTVRADGTWTLDDIGPLATGDVVRATATNLAAGEGTSALSAPVIVQPAPPTVNSPLLAGATTVTGTANEPAGSIITVYVDGVAVGTTTVQPGGTWTLSGVPALQDGQQVTATVTTGGQTSGPSAPVTVAANGGDVSTPPVVSSPITSGATSISGTSVEAPGSVVAVYVDGVIAGTTTVNPDGTWTLDGVGPLVTGQVVTATVTNAAAGEGTSAPSAPVIVGPTPPVVSSPLLAGGTSVSGTSIEPPGSTITVYVNGVAVGTTIVRANGTWLLDGVPPLADGDSVTARVTVGAQQSSPSAPVIVGANAGNISDPPVVGGPIVTGATSISGTSTEAAGTIIAVYVDGVFVGQATVQPGGTWTLTGVPPLQAGDVIVATATNLAAGEGTSGPSAPVTVGPAPPQVNGPLFAGGTTVTGTSLEPAGSVITVLVNGVPVGTTTVAADGTWTLNGVPPLADGNVVTATVQVGSMTSGPSAPVVVSANGGDVTPPPVVNDPIAALSTVVTGTGLPGATVHVYVDGRFVGTATVTGGGTWTLAGLAPLAPGAIVDADQTLSPTGTSVLSSPVVVGALPSLLRNDEVTSFTPVTPPLASIFTRVAGALPPPSLDPFGADGVADVGEGTLTEYAGSQDDDDFYMKNVTSGTIDPDPTVLTDGSRKLVFYQLVDSDHTLHVTKSGGRILITYVP